MIKPPTKPNSLLCRLGFHKSEILEANRQPVPVLRGMTMMTMHELYIDRCPRCGREKPFHFYIERF